MKSVLRISLLLNLALLGVLVFVLARRHSQEAIPASSEIKPSEPVVAAPAPPEPPKVELEPFRWKQLLSTNNYRAFVANLRAIGCPEPTIEDIVKGDVARAFSFERNQLRLDGSGDGPWSQAAANQLTASLLTAPANNKLGATSPATESGRTDENTDEVAQNAATTPDTGAVVPAYPLFLQNVNWSALGFNANQQAAIAEVRQRFQSEVSGLNQGLSTPANQISSDSNPNPAQRRQQAIQSADDQLRDLLGAQGYAAYEQQAYYNWYQPQVMAAAAAGGNLVINPGAFVPK